MEKTADILWKSCANGNNESFKSLFDTWYEPLCRYSCFFTGDSMDAEEVVLDFFMYIWHNRASIVIEKSFEAYAKTAVHNRSLNKIRSRNITRNWTRLRPCHLRRHTNSIRTH